MRAIIFTCVTLAALGGLAACSKQDQTAKTGDAAPATASAPVGPITPPHRKAGLWVQTMSTAGMKQTMKVCLDADTESKMTAWGQAVNQEMCSKNSLTPVPGGWKVEAVCAMGEAGTTTSTGVITGDFDSAYTMKMSSVTTGASMAQANGTHEMQMTATYSGPCPAGMKGGDVNIEVPGMKGGMTMNLEKMQAMAGKK